MTIEVKRKFIAPELRTRVQLGEGVQLRQGYLAEEDRTEVRVRITPTSATLTVKAGTGLSRTEVEVAITLEQAEALWPHTVGRRIDKVGSPGSFETGHAVIGCRERFAERVAQQCETLHRNLGEQCGRVRRPAARRVGRAAEDRRAGGLEAGGVKSTSSSGDGESWPSRGTAANTIGRSVSAMVSQNRWIAMTEEDPEHSARYIERFRTMAEERRDLGGEARLIDAMVARSSRILDAGCGPGRVGGHLADTGHHVVGVDVDPVLIDAARQDHPTST